MSPKGRKTSRGPAVVRALSLVVSVWAILPSVALGDPSALSSGDGACSRPGGSEQLRFASSLAGIGPSLVRLRTTGGPGSLYPNSDTAFEFPEPSSGFSDFFSAGTLWSMREPGTAGFAPAIWVVCGLRVFDQTQFAFHSDLYAIPTPPVSFEGSGDQQRSTVAFTAPGRARYALDVAVAQGGVGVTTGSVQANVASPRSVDVGSLAAGVNRITVVPLPGAAPVWSVAVRALPVQITAFALGRPAIRPGVVFGSSFTTDADGVYTATVLRGTTVVRTIAADRGAAAGKSTFSWDGSDAAGKDLPDGAYAIALSVRDRLGNVGTRRLPIAVDHVAPTLTRTSARRQRASRSLTISVGDRTSGIKRARLRVGGRTVFLRAGSRRLLGRPRGGWRHGHRYRFLAEAVDRAGNLRRLRGSVRV